MKKIHLLILIFLLAFSICGCKNNETFEYKGLLFKLEEDGNYAVTGYIDETTEHYEIPSTIKKRKVTVIGEKAFYEHQNIVSIDIPNTIIKIEQLAFYQCPSLLYVTIPVNVQVVEYAAFAGCKDLTSAVFLGETQIDMYTFSRCSALVNIVIPKVTKIGKRAFYETSSLRIVDIPSAVEIGEEAFRYSGIEKVVFGSGVRVIKELAFFVCENLETVIIEEGVETIEVMAFYRCKLLQIIDLPDSLITIGNGFISCTSITSLTLGKKVKNIGAIPTSSAELNDIAVDKDNPYFTTADGVLYNKDQTVLIAYPIGKNGDTYEIPDGVTTIGARAFEDSKLKTIIIPKSVVDIGRYIVNGSEIENINFCSEYNEEIYNSWDSLWKYPKKEELSIVFGYSKK